MLELDSRYLKMVLEILERHVSGMTVLAYGSRVKGLAHSGSDLDLVVINPQNIEQPQKAMQGLKDALIESDLPIHVDVLDWARIPDYFHDEINKNNVCIMGEMESAC